MSDKIELNRRRVLGGLVTIGAAGAAVGAGTFAYFSDTEESSGNEISAGTLDLHDTSSTNFNVSEAVPGESIPSSGQFEISSDYTGSIDPAVDIRITLSDPAEESDDPSNLASQLNLDTASLVHNEDGSETTVTELHTSNDTLNDLDDHTANDAFGDVTDGDTVRFDLEMTFDEDAEDTQDESVEIVIEFTARQPDASGTY